MAVLRSIEARIEDLFEGVFGRAFRSHVQPIELARKLVKEMDDHRSVSVSRVYVPNEYTLYLCSKDRGQFQGYEDSLRGELAEYLAEHARREGYALLTPPRVLLTTDDDLAIGEFGIATRVAAEEASAEDVALLPEPPVEEPQHTMVYRAAVPDEEPVHAVLTLDGKSRPITKPEVVLGRSREADLRLADANVSRKHAAIRREGEAYWVTDLGSTNGTEVNGERVTRHELKDGDRITLGATEVVFELPRER
ncbi:MAG TPA: DUF3662 and FHA domain-containing protein [Gaiellaceae bacterium]|nr:DUF3662 and FHA domain-containing protein [Gaiellaceae bacterium]